MPKSTGGSAISTGMPQPLRKSRFVKLPLSCTGCAVLASLLAARPATTAISLPNTRTIKLCAWPRFSVSHAPDGLPCLIRKETSMHRPCDEL